VNPSPVPAPSNQLFGREADRDHQELEVEPVGAEPQKQVDAENHRERTETQGVDIPPRPCEQHVEGVRKKQLRGDQRRRVVDRSPVPAPVDQHGTLSARLQVVLCPNDDRDVQRSIGGVAPPYQEGIPRDECAGGDEQRPQHVPVAARLGQESERDESPSDGGRDARNKRAQDRTVGVAVARPADVRRRPASRTPSAVRLVERARACGPATSAPARCRRSRRA